MKKKKILAIIIILCLLIVIIFITNVDYQKIETDKDVYNVGENISYTITHFDLLNSGILEKCIDAGYYTVIFKKENDEWIYVDFPLSYSQKSNICINGELHPTGFHIKERIRYCFGNSLFTLFKKSFTKDFKIYKQIGEESCNYDASTYEGKGYNGKPIPSFEYKQASPGIYKIKYLNTEKIIKIK